MDFGPQEPPPPKGSLVFLHKHAPVWNTKGNAVIDLPGTILVLQDGPAQFEGFREWEEDMEDEMALGLIRGFSANLGYEVDFLQIDIVEKFDPKGVG